MEKDQEEIESKADSIKSTRNGVRLIWIAALLALILSIIFFIFNHFLFDTVPLLFNLSFLAYVVMITIAGIVNSIIFIGEIAFWILIFVGYSFIRQGKDITSDSHSKNLKRALPLLIISGIFSMIIPFVIGFFSVFFLFSGGMETRIVFDSIIKFILILTEFIYYTFLIFGIISIFKEISMKRSWRFILLYGVGTIVLILTNTLLYGLLFFSITFSDFGYFLLIMINIVYILLILLNLLLLIGLTDILKVSDRDWMTWIKRDRSRDKTATDLNFIIDWSITKPGEVGTILIIIVMVVGIVNAVGYGVYKTSVMEGIFDNGLPDGVRDLYDYERSTETDTNLYHIEGVMFEGDQEVWDLDRFDHPRRYIATLRWVDEQDKTFYINEPDTFTISIIAYDQDENIVLEDSESGENPQGEEGSIQCSISLSHEIEEECEYYRLIVECNDCGNYGNRVGPTLIGQEDLSNEFLLSIETEFLLPAKVD